MRTLFSDVAFGFRLLRRSPGFATTAILTLALGIGATTAMFSVINAVVLNPFPYPRSGEIMFVTSFLPEDGRVPVTYPDYLDFRRQNHSFEHLAAARGLDFSLTERGLEPVKVHGATVSADSFPMLGVTPLMGRIPREDEDREGAPRVAVLSYGLWQRRYGGTGDVLGRQITLDGKPYTIIGVMPESFRFWAADIWVPIGLNFMGEYHASRVVRYDMYAVGRLRPGVTPQVAKADLEVIARRLQQAYPDSNKDVGVDLVPLRQSVTANIRPTLLILFGSVGFILLIACANVANLLMARAADRGRELAVRTALGASRLRLARQLLFECAPLSVVGTGVGLLLAWWLIRLVLLLVPEGSLPAESEVRIDGWVLAFTVAVSMLTVLATGLFPALQHSRVVPASGLTSVARGSTTGRHGRRLRDALVVAEVALSLALLAGAGLLLSSFARVRNVEVGFEPDRVLAMRISLPEARYPNAHQTRRFFEVAIGRIASMAGVERVGAISTLPLSRTGSDMPVVTEGHTYTSLNDLPSSQFSVVLGDYFRAMKIQVEAGRLFDRTDTDSSPRVVVVNDAFVRRFFPDVNPLGRRVLLGVPDNLMRDDLVPGITHFDWLTIVGVVGSVRKFALDQPPAPEAYIPYAQSPLPPMFLASMFIVARTGGDPLSIAGAVREQIWALDRDQPIAQLTTMSAFVGRALEQPRFSLTLLGAFAGVALVLALVGLYGVLSYAVTQRSREIGIRLALGAAGRDVLRHIVGQGATLMAIGIVLGLGLTVALTRVLQNLLYEVSATDPTVLALVAAVLGAVGLAACYVPARRAMRIDPVEALRAE